MQVTVTVTDNAKNANQATATLVVRERVVVEFEDVHFDFDRNSLRPEETRALPQRALAIDDERCPEALRQVGRGNPADPQDAGLHSGRSREQC